mgnify:CR=1 FL=1
MNGMLLLSIFDSVIRNRNDIKIFIIGNAVPGIEYSPLFSFFDLTLPYRKRYKIVQRKYNFSSIYEK